MSDKGEKRQASPLESQIMKRRYDKVYASQGTSRAWITVEKPSSRQEKKAEKVNTRSAQKMQKLHETGSQIQHGASAGTMNSDRIRESLSNLELLYAGLKQEVHAIHTDLDKKLDGFMRDQAARFEIVERIQKGQDLQIREVKEKLDFHNEKIVSFDDKWNSLNREFTDLNIGELRSTVLELRDKVEDLEKNQAEIQNQKGWTEEQSQFMYEVARRLEYHESRLKRHDGVFLDVFAELRDKAISINGLPEEQNENLLDKVLVNINAMIAAAIVNPIPINRNDIDMVYRTGRRNYGNTFPRPVTVIFVRKGLKQWILATKKNLGWDTYSKVTYSEDMTPEMRKHREQLKSVAAKANEGDYVVKMAGNKIHIDGVIYGYEDLDILPVELRNALPQQKNVKKGVAFRGKDSFLSNFYQCDIRIDGELFTSVEQYYQSQKCTTCEEPDRALKIMSSDDPHYIKRIGDDCPENYEWLESKVYVMFKGLFYKFSQNESLALKLLATEKQGLFEATTDHFYGAGVGWHSKKWGLYSWEGKNIMGTLLTKVRRILGRKMEEGYDLRRLVFNYSLPSLKQDKSSKHRELFLSQIDVGAPIIEEEYQSDMEVDAQQPEIRKPQTSGETMRQEIGELSRLVDELEAKHSKGSDSSSLLSMCGAAKRKSHSVRQTPTGVKQRNNPTRQYGSLTSRERQYIYRHEEDNVENTILKGRGFDRGYGISHSDKPQKTSTPMNRIPGNTQSKDAERKLVNYLNQDEVSPVIHTQAKTRRPDTPIPGYVPEAVHEEEVNKT